MTRQPTIAQFPHCDSRVLHAPGECRYCDAHPEWQELRKAWGIAFTGKTPVGIARPVLYGNDGRRHRYEVVVDRDEWTAPLPCPADFNRPPLADNDHRRWAGNVATTQQPVNETAASRTLYGTSPSDLRIGSLTTERETGRTFPRLSALVRLVTRDRR